jgi:sigma-54 dependent transcriptional regulator, acetoin dehydrogenase operon transcriptional activator AcoR
MMASVPVTEVAGTTEQGSGAGEGGAVAEAHLFRLADCGRPLDPAARHVLRGVDLVTFGRGERGARREGGRIALTEPDGRISSAHAQLRRVPGRWLVEDLGSTNGTLVNGASVRTAALDDGDLIEIGRVFFLYRDAVPTPPDEPADWTAPQEAAVPGLVTLSPVFAHRLRELEAITRSMVSVVIQGESGTGKELVARAVHTLSGRSGPFVAVNCGAIPATLIESELFGVRRGAFSEAREDRPGLIRSAHGGTLLLDEIGDLPLAMQAAFLRVLQEREVVPLGQAKPVPVDVRVICASHRSLEELVRRGAFREDLWSRLCGFPIELPPLRERREDLGLLVAALLSRLAPRPDKVSFHPAAMRAILACPWPRNVRELEKHLEAALVLAGTGPILASHLGKLAAAATPATPSPRPPEPAELSPADAALRAELERALDEHGGNLAAVGRAMGKDRTQIRRWLGRFGLDPDAYRR